MEEGDRNAEETAVRVLTFYLDEDLLFLSVEKRSKRCQDFRFFRCFDYDLHLLDRAFDRQSQSPPPVRVGTVSRTDRGSNHPVSSSWFQRSNCLVLVLTEPQGSCSRPRQYPPRTSNTLLSANFIRLFCSSQCSMPQKWPSYSPTRSPLFCRQSHLFPKTNQR